MKRLVVCCDGTWNAPESLEPEDRPPTNVLKMSRAILPMDGSQVVQVVEYVRGIGTGNLIDRWIGGATGKGISSNILQAYQFISNNFLCGDHLYLFGFSRGGYTARSLSGFIYHFGILHKAHQHLLPSLYELYQKTPKKLLPLLVKKYADKIDHDLADREKGFIPIQFIGVWDTVGALGAPVGVLRRRQRGRIGFHDTELAPNVTYAYHALALNEYRVNFAPTLWTSKRGGQIVEQVWFPGSHCDIGGGVISTGLSDIAFGWLAERAAGAGLAMNKAYLGGLRPFELAPITDSRTGIYKLRQNYLRPIGPKYLETSKPVSLDEFRHRSVYWRLALMDLMGSPIPQQDELAGDRAMDPALPEMR